MGPVGKKAVESIGGGFWMKRPWALSARRLFDDESATEAVLAWDVWFLWRFPGEEGRGKKKRREGRARPRISLSFVFLCLSCVISFCLFSLSA